MTPGTVDTLWLMLAGGGAAAVRVLWTGGQKNLSYESLQDVVIGVLIGGLWTAPMPSGIAAVWPPFEFAATASMLQKGLMVSAFSLAGVEVLKKVLLKWAPEYINKLGGRLAPPTDGGTK
jgi:hypothetical protein